MFRIGRPDQQQVVDRIVIEVADQSLDARRASPARELDLGRPAETQAREPRCGRRPLRALHDDPRKGTPGALKVIPAVAGEVADQVGSEVRRRSTAAGGLPERSIALGKGHWKTVQRRRGGRDVRLAVAVEVTDQPLSWKRCPVGKVDERRVGHAKGAVPIRESDGQRPPTRGAGECDVRPAVAVEVADQLRDAGSRRPGAEAADRAVGHLESAVAARERNWNGVPPSASGERDVAAGMQALPSRIEVAGKGGRLLRLGDAGGEQSDH